MKILSRIPQMFKKELMEKKHSFLYEAGWFALKAWYIFLLGSSVFVIDLLMVFIFDIELTDYILKFMPLNESYIGGAKAIWLISFYYITLAFLLVGIKKAFSKVSK